MQKVVLMFKLCNDAVIHRFKMQYKNPRSLIWGHFCSRVAMINRNISHAGISKGDNNVDIVKILLSLQWQYHWIELDSTFYRKE